MGFDRNDATEQPTATRLKRAREEGQVARSSDFSSSLLSLAAIGIAVYWIPQMIQSMKQSLVQGLSFSSANPSSLIAELGTALLQMLWLPCVILLFVAILAGVVQVGGLFAPQAANMKPERINPTTGWERLWGGHGWMNLLFSCCKLTASVLAGGWVAWVHRAELLSLSQSSLDESLVVIAIVSGKIVFASVASLFILGLLDIVWQRHQWKEGLKMTRQEVMNERKEQEGNQQIRSYRRITPFSQHVRDSIEPSLVLVGKTIAVSIRWNPTTMSAPVVLAFIQGDEIQKLVAKATSLAIPVQTNDWLCARVELGCDVGHALPPSLHSEIASILRVKRSKTA